MSKRMVFAWVATVLSALVVAVSLVMIIDAILNS